MADRFPSLESLRVFEASARHGNFSRAAGELGVTPTAVSLRIRNLELDLNCRLFIRSGPRLSLTNAGRELSNRMAKILALTRSAVAACRGSAAPLRLTSTPTIARAWLASILPRYEQLGTASTIRLDVSPDIRSPATFDVAIRSGHGYWPGFESTLLLPILKTPMLSPRMAQQRRLERPDDLLAFPLIREEHWPQWVAAAGVAAGPMTFAPIEYETQDVVALAAAEGAGVALLSPLLFRDFLADGRLIQPFEQEVSDGSAYYVLRHADDDRPHVDHFIQWLRGQARATYSAKTVSGLPFSRT